jgi:hypothetical protein
MSGAWKGLGVLLALLAASAAAPAAQKAADSTRVTPVRSAVTARADSLARLARADSSLMLDSAHSAGDYLIRREQYLYPPTRRSDPFALPFGKAAAGESPMPTLEEIDLTGVLFSPDGRSMAIMLLPSGRSFLLREGDQLGSAEVFRIERSRVHFRIRNFGTVSTAIKELKPLVEGKDGTSPEKAGEANRQQEEVRPGNDESGGPAPERP